MKTINYICFYVCLLCIIAGATVSILTVWQVVEDKTFYLRTLMTLGILFAASMMTTMVNRAYPGRVAAADGED